MTAGATLGLTYYAWTTEEDFTLGRGIVQLAGTALLMIVAMFFITNTELVELFGCFLIVLVYGIYLIVDT
jgi:FtsH-binding integral membrane protein